MPYKKEYSDLEIYISYDFLTLQQQVEILSAIDEVHKIVQLTMLNSNYKWTSPPLCITTAYTGNSITLGFDTENIFLPELRSNDKNIELMLPKWTMGVIIVGALLSGGLDYYEQYLNIQKTHLEIEKIEIEQKEYNLDKLKDKNNSLHYKCMEKINKFNSVINQTNIKIVKINNIIIKENKNDKE